MSDVFDGSMESAVRCLTCNNVSTVTETFEVRGGGKPEIPSLSILHALSPLRSGFAQTKRVHRMEKAITYELQLVTN